MQTLQSLRSQCINPIVERVKDITVDTVSTEEKILSKIMSGKISQDCSRFNITEYMIEDGFFKKRDISAEAFMDSFFKVIINSIKNEKLTEQGLQIYKQMIKISIDSYEEIKNSYKVDYTNPYAANTKTLEKVRKIKQTFSKDILEEMYKMLKECQVLIKHKK